MISRDEHDESAALDASSTGRARLSKRVTKLAWLADADLERADEKMARLEGDRVLADTLAACNYQGPNYVAFANEIAKYGLAVILGWIYRGLIWSKIKEKSWGSIEPEPWPGSLIEDAQALADETVVKALVVFRDKVLIPGKWDPRKGASLRTFFVGQCLKQFCNVYRDWRREQIRNFINTTGLDQFENTHVIDGDPSLQVTRLEELRTVLGKITDERARAAFYLQAIHGHNYREIGEKLSMSEKAVESAIGRARAQLQNGENIA